MARLKAMVRSALEDRSPGFMLATIALAVAVSLVAGFAIGYKVEESRGKPAKKTATKKHTGKTAQPKPIRLKGAPLLIGGVYAVRPKQLVVLGADAKPKRIGIGPNTRVAVAEAGKSTDVVVGSHVLFQPSPRSRTKAVEVVVLPAKAAVGAAVAAVLPGKAPTS